MSNNIGNNNYLYSLEDVRNLAKYATGTAINNTELSPTDGLLGFAGMDLGVKSISWYRANKGHRLESLKQNFTPNLAKSKEYLRELKANPKSTLMNGYRQIEIGQMLNKIPKAPAVAEGAQITQKIKNAQVIAQKYEPVKTLLENAKTLKGDALKVATKNIELATAQAKYDIHLAKRAGEILPTTKVGKASRYIAQKTGASALKGKYLKAMTKSSKLRTISKLGKGGNAAFAVLSLAAKAPEIYTTYQVLGTEKGNKELGKAVVNTAAEVGGWIVGAKAGAIAGAAIGSCIPVPVVGTAVGAVVGLACGFLGSWLASKAAKAVTGPSELEKANEEQLNQIAEAAIQDESTMNELMDAAAQRLIEEQQSDVKSEDYEAGYEAFQNVYNTAATKELLADASVEAASQNQESTEESTTPDVDTENYVPEDETTEKTDKKTNQKATTKENSNNKVKNEKLATILANLSQLVGNNNYAAGANYGYTPGITDNIASFNPFMMSGFNPTLPSPFGFNGMNNFNQYPQFGFMA